MDGQAKVYSGVRYISMRTSSGQSIPMYLLCTVIFAALEHYRSDALASLPELREEENAEDRQRPVSFARGQRSLSGTLWTRQLILPRSNAEVRHFVHELVGWVIVVVKLLKRQLIIRFKSSTIPSPRRSDAIVVTFQPTHWVKIWPPLTYVILSLVVLYNAVHLFTSNMAGTSETSAGKPVLFL